MSTESDLSTLRAYLADFEAYLKAEVVFWNVGSNAPALTIGGVLLLRRTLAAGRSQRSAAQIAQLDQLETQANALFNQWQSNIEKKALREISARLNVWATALEECAEHPAACADNYAQTVKTRVILGLLKPLVAQRAEAAPHLKRLETLDSRLRNMIVLGDFIWEPSLLAAAFPPNEFWFLSGQPRRAK